MVSIRSCLLHETRESEPDANATRVRILLLFHKIFRIDHEGARLTEITRGRGFGAVMSRVMRKIDYGSGRNLLQGGGITPLGYFSAGRAQRVKGGGNLKKLTYGNGQYVEYTYDEFDRLVKMVYNSGRYVTYTYNAEGSLAKLTYGDGTTEKGSYTFEYDSLGRPARKITAAALRPTIMCSIYRAM